MGMITADERLRMTGLTTGWRDEGVMGRFHAKKAYRRSGFGAPANLADWPRQGSNPGPTGFEAKRLSRPVSREPTPLISGNYVVS